jgi:hypothetical protein
MNSASAQVGKDIVTQCNKCKMNLSHIVVSLKENGNVAKVKCNTCKSVHMFRDKSASPKAAKKQTNVSKFLQEIARRKDPSKNSDDFDSRVSLCANPKSYTIKEKFSVGDVIQHPQFGPGIVSSSLEKDKIIVQFKTIQKMLIHNKH